MHLGEISFCDHVAYNIKCEDTKKAIMEQLTRYNVNIIQRHHQTFTNELIPVLNNNPHAVSLRSNGNPYLLFLTRHNSINVCMFIDKKIQQGYFLPRIILTKMWFGDVLYNDTIFEGEMVKNKNGTWSYLVSDIIVESGKHLGMHNLVKRLERTVHIFSTMYVHNRMLPFDIVHKQYYHYPEFPKVVELMNTSPFTCRGVYFKPLFLKFKDILVNADDSVVVKVVKQKYKDHGNFLLNPDDVANPKTNEVKEINTYRIKPVVDTHKAEDTVVPQTTKYYLRKTSSPDIYDLFDEKQSLNMTACVNTLATSKMLKQAFKDKTLVDKLLFECSYCSQFGKHIPVRFIGTN